MLEVSESQYKPVIYDTLLDDRVQGLIKTTLLQPEHAIVNTYVRRFDRSLYKYIYQKDIGLRRELGPNHMMQKEPRIPAKILVPFIDYCVLKHTTIYKLTKIRAARLTATKIKI